MEITVIIAALTPYVSLILARRAASDAVKGLIVATLCLPVALLATYADLT